jgi:phosphatidylserine/phosphatidylglycerophosphate/cardiolipin synthase-like enzyme
MTPSWRMWGIIILVQLALGGGGVVSHAHQDPCHRLPSCPSDRGSYVCGDKGRCDQCPDNQYCLAGKPRVAAPGATSTPSASTSNRSFTPEGVTVCFTPGGNCTERIVKTLGEAKRTILVQAYSFTSAPIAKALLEAHTRGVPGQVILDKVRHEAWPWNERISPPPVQADGEPLGRSVRGMHSGGETAGPERYR